MNSRPKIFVIDKEGTPRPYPLYRYSEVCVRREAADTELAGKLVNFVLANVEYDGRIPRDLIGNIIHMTVQFDAEGYAFRNPLTKPMREGERIIDGAAGIVRPGDPESSFKPYKLGAIEKTQIRNLIFGKEASAS